MDSDAYLSGLCGSLSSVGWLNVVPLLAFLLSQFVLLVASSCFEAYIFSLTPRQIADFKSSGNRAFVHLCKMLQEPRRTVASLMLTHYVSASSVVVTSSVLVLWVASQDCVIQVFPVMHWNKFLPVALMLAIVPFLLLFFFGEVVPGFFFDKSEEKSLPRWIINLTYLADRVLSPLSRVLCSLSTVVERRLDAKTQHSISLDELNETLKFATEEKKEETEILQGIVNFGRISADEIMRPRVDIVDIDLTCSFSEVVRIIRESEYSRLPVYEGTIDNVKGILYIKDVMQYIGREDGFKWQSLVRKAYFVPESKKIDDLMKEFQEKRIHMAIVVDEFGGTAGIVTLEDILEVIVGDICDEHDGDEHKLYSSLDEKHFIIDAKLPLPDFFKIKGVDKEKFENVCDDADTLAGLLLELNGDIPSQGAVIEHEGYEFKIASADNRRIKKVKLQIP